MNSTIDTDSIATPPLGTPRLPAPTSQTGMNLPSLKLDALPSTLNIQEAEAVFKRHEEQQKKRKQKFKSRIKEPQVVTPEPDTIPIHQHLRYCSPMPTYPANPTLTILQKYYDVPLDTIAITTAPKPNLITLQTPKETTTSEPSYAYKHTSSVLIFTIALLLFFALIQRFYRKEMLNITAGIFNYRTANRILKEDKIIENRLCLWSNLLFALSTASLFYHLLPSNFILKTLWQPWQLTLTLSLAVFLLYKLKAWTWALFGNLFLQSDFTWAYVKTTTMHNSLIAWLITIPVAVLPYVGYGLYQTLIIIIISLILFFLIMRYIRTAQIFLKQNRAYVSYFLYFCGAEILPLILLSVTVYRLL